MVENKTGLSGLYDVNLRWTPLTIDQVSGPDGNNDGSDLFTALREQLGLKIVAAQVMEDRYEIQAAERPGPN